jgi:ribosomal protein L12E/L44/L45/RPP1/RPP2
MEENKIDVAELELENKAYRIKLTPAGTQKRIDNKKVREVLERAGIDVELVEKEINISSQLTITEKDVD